jgi:hypothetical protein
VEHDEKKRTVQLIAEHAALADAIGGTPSEWACYRFIAKLREHSTALADCVDEITGGAPKRASRLRA